MPIGDYSVPRYFKRGVLPRRTRFGQLEGVPVFSDAVPTIAVSDWPDVLADKNKPECSSLIWNVYDQDGVGSCASEGINKGNETIRKACGREDVQFNPLFVYHTVSGGYDGGSSLDDNVSFVMEKGCCPESVYPRSKGFRATPPDSAYEAALNYRVTEIFDIDTSSSTQFHLEFGSALLQGFPVYFGYSGHAILGTELIDTDTVKYINSWGDWGDNGFGTISFNRIMRSYGAFAIRVPTEES